MAKGHSARAFHNRVDNMLNNRVESHIVDLKPEDMLFEYYDKCLKLVMHGEPISDSRPRFLKDREGTYNPHKAFLMRVFKKLYEQDELLRKTCICTPLAIAIRNYVTPTKALQKAIGIDIINENYVSIKQKDNDNIEKVHWDVLQDSAYKVILDDRLLTHNSSSQFYSTDPRIEIDIHFPSDDMLRKNNKYFKPLLDEIHKLAEYKKLKLLPKYTQDMNDIPDKKFPMHFFNTLADVGGIGPYEVGRILGMYSANKIALLVKYCGKEVSTRTVNNSLLADIIMAETYPVRKKKRILE